MVADPHFLQSRTCGRGATALVFLISLATVVLALAADKAMYVGGALRDSPKGGLGAQVLPSPEGAEVVLWFRGEEFRSPEYLQAGVAASGKCCVDPLLRAGGRKWSRLRFGRHETA